MNRDVQPEWLDELPPDDRRAVHSRADLQRINAWMGHAGTLSRALRNAFGPRIPRSVVDLGGGDGVLLLRVARRMAPRWTPSRVLLVDRQNLVSAKTRAGFAALSWPIEVAESDVFAWLDRPSPEVSDVTLATLFLHHFKEPDLRRLLGRVAEQTRLFVACEPRRHRVAQTVTGLLPVIGCNAVTRHDAYVSVKAGFSGADLSRLWPRPGWRLVERPAGLFTHAFSAERLAG